MRIQQIKKGIILGLLTMLVIVSLILPKSAFAIDFDDPSNIGGFIYLNILKPAWEKGGALAYRNSINFILKDLARQTGEWAATGFTGQKPLFVTDKKYWSKMEDNILGEFITQYSKKITGLDLCDPFDPMIRFKILVSMDPEYQKIKDNERLRCPYSEIKKRVEKLRLKDLYDFEIELRSGPVAQYKVNVETLLSGDVVLNKAKSPLVCDARGNISVSKCVSGDNLLGHYVNQGVQKLLNISQDLSDIQEQYETFISEDIKLLEDNDINDVLDVYKDDLQSFVWAWELKDDKPDTLDIPGGPDSLSFWKQFASTCAAKGHEDFCGSDDCMGIFIYTVEPPATCWDNNDETKTDLNNYTNAIKYTERINSYVKQLVDWANTLENMIEKSKPGEEGIDLPDLDPLEDINRMMSPGRSDIGALAVLQSHLFKKQTTEAEESKFFQSLQGQMKSVTAQVSDWVKTPSIYVSEATRQAVKSQEDPASFGQYTEVAAADALSVFKATLINSLLKRLQQGINPQTDPDEARKTPFLPDNEEGGSPYSPGIEEAKAMFAELKAPPIKSGREITIYDDFLNCPSPANPSYNTPMNCVVNDKLARAVEEHLTIADAICLNKKNCSPLLDPDAKVGQKDDYDSLLSLNNIKKLRRARIVPMGIEIAASKIFNKEIGNTKYTLEQIVTGFDQVNPLGACAVINGNFEIDHNNDDVPDGWVRNSGMPSEGASELTSERAYDGSLSYKVHVPKSKADAWYGLYYDNDGNGISVLPNTQYTISAYIKTQEINGDVGLRMHCHNKSHTGADNVRNNRYDWDDDTKLLITQANQDWTQVWGTFTTDKLADNCHIIPSFSKGGYGTAYFDGVQITKGAEVPEKYKGDASPFCHLVDPNWVLKANTYQCEEQGFSAIPTPRTEDRQETCVNLKDCIKEDESGECLAWAYCMREKNIWRLDGDQCEEQYAGCQSYTRLKDGKKVSYLETTTDSGECSEASAGCQWYCTDFNNTWNCMQGPETGKSVFFNNKVEQCSPDTQGCREYIRTTDAQNSDRTIDLEAAYEINDNVYLANAPVCEERDSGCRIYTPSDNRLSIQGIVNIEDRCPAQCVGYETFQQMPTNFDTNTSWVNFIPETTQLCSVPGCEEFTNLDTVAAGGEGLEYYSYLRQCAKLPEEAASCANFYTWIGSETTGYQLKRYQLEAVPQGQLDAGSPARVSDVTPPELGKCDDATDALLNPHCKEFYDESGNKHYRLYKNTITCSEDCRPYRKTVPAIYDNIDETRCSEIGGSWDVDDGYCEKILFSAIPGQGEVCTVRDVGCREYKGPTANNVRQVFFDDFENNTIEPWEKGETPPVNAAVDYPGHSMKVNGETEGVMRPIADLVSQNKSYIVSLWVTKTPDIKISFSSFPAVETYLETGLNIDEWQEVKSKPFYFDQEPSSIENLEISRSGDNVFYIDKITLKEISDNVYAIENSWFTPQICDQDLDGNDSPGAMRGCQLYTDKHNNHHYLKSFTRLCKDSAVGCEALINTQNYSSEQDQNKNGLRDGNTFNTNNTDSRDDVEINEDEIVYLINSEDYTCQAKDKGCEKMGLPKLSQDGAVVGWDTIYLKNDPDEYEKGPVLCELEDLGCEAYEGGINFKDPEFNNKLCEYRENVILGGEEKNGWFRKGTDQACYYNANAAPYMIDGGSYGIYQSDNDNYKGWVGMCPSSAISCTQYVDPGWAGKEINNIMRTSVTALNNWDNSFAGDGTWDTEVITSNPISACIGGRNNGNTCNISQDCASYSCRVEGWRGTSPVCNNVEQECKFGVCEQNTRIVCDKEADCGLNSQASGRCAQKADDQWFCKNPDGTWREIACGTESNNTKNPDSSLCEVYYQCQEDSQIGTCKSDGATCETTIFDIPAGFKEALYIKTSGSSKGGFYNNKLSYDGMALYSIWAKVIKGAILFGDITEPADTDKYISISADESNGGWIQKTKIVDSPSQTYLYAEKETIAYITGPVLASAPTTYYYYLDNDKFDTSTCQGSVLLKQGCVLFNDPNISTLSYNSLASYKADAFSPDTFTAPVSCKVKTADYCKDPNNTDSDYCLYCEPYGQAGNDANTIIKVKQDRVCGEWLSCISWFEEFDSVSGTTRKVCNAVGRCNKLSGDECVNFVYPKPEVLTEEVYQSRDTSFYGMDYSGYSLYNTYPVEQLFLVEQPGSPDTYNLTYKDAKAEIKGVDGSRTFIGKTCKLYPEIDSPFTQDTTYTNVNVCEDEYGDQCQCSYTKADYGEKRKYYNRGSKIPSPGICIGGDRDGESCLATDSNSCPGGRCIVLEKQSTMLGQTGYCLEPDLSKQEAGIDACITWWLGQSLGDASIYQQFETAGYSAEPNNQLYCMDSTSLDISLEDSHMEELTYPDDFNFVQSHSDAQATLVSGDSNDCFDIEDEIETKDYYKLTPEFKESYRITEYMIDRILIEDNQLLMREDGGGCNFSSDKCGDNYDGSVGMSKNGYDDGDPDETIEWRGRATCKSDNELFVQAQFDKNRFLSGFKFRFSDGSNGWGRAKITGATIVLKSTAVCKYLVNVVTEDSNLTTAWTDKLWSQGDYYKKNYGALECDPYGAVGITAPGEGYIIITPDGYICTSETANKKYTKPHLQNLFARAGEQWQFSEDLVSQICMGASSGSCASDNASCWEDTDCSIIEAGVCEFSSDEEFGATCTSGHVLLPCDIDDECDLYDTCQGAQQGFCSKSRELSCEKDIDCLDIKLEDTGTTGYVRVLEQAWDQRQDRGVNHVSPQVDKLTINEQSGNIEIGGGSYSAELKFYAWADTNHMPVREIIVDWIGDLTPELVERYSKMMAKNHRQTCNSAPVDQGGQGFGGSDGACVEEPWQFTRILTCVNDSSPGWEKHGCEDACCFKPTVYVKDNWGWCNGGEYVGDISCDSGTGTIGPMIIVKPQ